MDFYMDETLHYGRPATAGNRLEKEMACYDLLDELEIFFTRVDHAAADTIAQCETAEKVLGEKICKNLFLCNRQKTNYYLLLLDGAKVFKTKDLSKQLGVARLSFAGAEEMAEFLNITPGSVSPMGLMNDTQQRVQLVIDRSVADAEKIGCHPCINTASIAFSMTDMLEKFLPAVKHTPIFVDLPMEEDA